MLAIDFLQTEKIIPKEKSIGLAQNKANKMFGGIACNLLIVEISTCRQVTQYSYHLLNHRTRLLFRIYCG